MRSSVVKNELLVLVERLVPFDNRSVARSLADILVLEGGCVTYIIVSTLVIVGGLFYMDIFLLVAFLHRDFSFFLHSESRCCGGQCVRPHVAAR